MPMGKEKSKEESTPAIYDQVDAIYRSESRSVFASLVFDASGFEIRPIADMTLLRQASNQRRKSAGKS